MGFTSIQGQITQMIVHETGGNTVTFQIANVDSVTYDTTAIATCPATFTDARDNEVYAVVQIGNQCWMAENLRYNASGSWLNSANLSTTYGRLYDWATVMNNSTTSSSNPSGVQGICPSGWHLPSDSEWNELEVALGMPAADTANTGYRGTHGTGMKSTTGWNSSGNGTNTSGFNAFPAGLYSSGSFGGLGVNTGFWSSTEHSLTTAWRRSLSFGSTGVYRYTLDETYGASCRCAKD
jgi:uncharacterized protein (TIGR02145 family)